MADTPADHEAEDTPSRVFVNNVRLPVGDVDIHVRKEGSLDVTRYLEFEFASPHNGTEFTNAFRGLTPQEQSEPDTVRVDVRDRVTEEYHTEFHGMITGVGNAAEGGDKWWTARAQGPGHYVSQIPASERFENISVRDALDYIINELDRRLPIPVSIETAPEDTTDPVEDADVITAREAGQTVSSAGGRELAGKVRNDTITITTPKTFQYGKHTLSDVMSWVGQKTDLNIWLKPSASGVSLVATNELPLNAHQADYLGGDTRIIDNNALVELRPVNTQVVKAKAKASVEDVNTYQMNEASETIVAVKARHQPLYERAGGVELHAETERLSDASTKEEAVNEAKSLLKSNIDETTAGDMQTLLRSPITPYDTVEALPTVDSESSDDTNSFTYEISRVHHEVTASGISETNLNVGLHIDSEDIEIIDSWRPEAI